MEFHMINITYAALHVRAETEKTTFSCKDDCTLKKHTRRWTYYALQYFSLFWSPCMVLCASLKHIPACSLCYYQHHCLCCELVPPSPFGYHWFKCSINFWEERDFFKTPLCVPLSLCLSVRHKWSCRVSFFSLCYWFLFIFLCFYVSFVSLCS